MKKLITIVALVATQLFVNNTYSQTNIEVNNQIQDINLRLDKYSHQNHVGNGLIFWGVVTSVIGVAIISNENLSISSTSPFIAAPNLGAGIIIAGSALTTSGLIVNLNSHRKLRSNQYKHRYPNLN
jgi:hypothetical protein